ncbi:MAG: RHS repeat-associated core domain-containing protein, partial [Candidatus Binataceae bacterium]
NNYADTFNYDFLDDVVKGCTPEGTLTKGFDNIGRVQSMSVSNTSYGSVSYGWDDANELTGLTNGGNSTSINYTPDGQRKSLSVSDWGMTVTTNYSYDDPLSERLTGITYASTQNSSLGNLTYSYDADGRVTGKAGSFATFILPASWSGTASYLSTNQIHTWWNNISPSFNNNEGLTSDPVSTLTYGYDARNELLNAGSDSYSYDAGGRRESVTSGGQNTTYLYDGTTPIMLSGSTSFTTLPDSNEILTVTPANQVPLHDELGSVIGAVGTNGNLSYQYTYDPFGNLTANGPSVPSGYGNVYGMAGMEHDPSGLYHANARYFSPTLMRFLNEDPERGKANMYTYAGNNPITGSDPSGMEPTWLTVMQAGAAFGGGGGEGGGGTGLIATLIWDVLVPFLDSSSASQVINYQRFQNEHMFGKLNGTLGVSSEFNIMSDGGPGLDSLPVDLGSEWGGILRVQEIIVEPPLEGNDFLPDWETAPAEDEPPEPPDPDDPNEHTKNKRPSSEPKHEKGQARKRMDRRGGEKGDDRRPYRQRGLWLWFEGDNNEI